MRKTLLLTSALPLSALLGCEPSLIGVGGPPDTNGKGNMGVVLAPDYVPVMRVMLQVNKQQQVLAASGDLLLQYKKISGDGYWLTAGSIAAQGDEQLNVLFRGKEDAGLTKEIPVPRADFTIPAADFGLTDVSQRRPYSILIRNFDRPSGVASYQRVYIAFEAAMIDG